MSFFQANINGDPNIGLYGFATDNYCFVGASGKIKERFNRALKVRIFSCPAMNTDFAGLFVAGNSHGVIAPKILEEYELDRIKKIFNVLVLDSDFSAIGNLVLMNDHGIILSPLIRKHKNKIEKFFSLQCAVSGIAGTSVVGSAAVATNRGCLAHPKIREREIGLIEDVLRVKVEIGTVNFGSSFVKSGIIANSHGFIASTASSGPELGRINEALGFLP